MNNELQKAINLSKKTGDRLIVFNSNHPDMTYVVMSLSEYENLTLKNRGVQSLTEQELLDKINRDIAVWKTEQFSFDESEYRERKKIVNKNNFKHDNIVSEDYYSEDDYGDYEKAEKEKIKFTPEDELRNENTKGKKAWKIPSERKEAAEEVIEEDRQYLEEIPF